LTAVFFDIDPTTVALTPVSAKLAGSTVYFGTSGVDGNVGGEWAYGSGLTGAPGNAGLGTSSSGFNLFGQANFNGDNLQGPAAVDGLQYGITSAGDDPATGNTPVTGENALIKNAVTFTFRTSGPDPIASIRNVSFQYGTGLTEPRITSIVPIPASVWSSFAMLGLLGIGQLRKKK